MNLVVHSLILAASIGVLATVTVLRQQRDWYTFVPDAELARLREFTTAPHAPAPADTELLRGSPETWVLPDDWSLQPLPTPRWWQLQNESTPSWTGFIQLLSQLQAVPGVRIQSLQIRSHGSRSARTIASIRLQLACLISTPPRPTGADEALLVGAMVATTTPAVGLGRAALPPVRFR